MPELDTKRAAYDLALLYAQAQFQKALEDPEIFRVLGEREYLLDQFMSAFELYSGLEREDWEAHYRAAEDRG